MAEAKLSIEVYKNATSAWHQYLSDLSPLRPALYRYCRGLTGNTWDADDLVQETLMRGFSVLGLGQDEIKDPRAYLLRIAYNARDMPGLVALMLDSGGIEMMGVEMEVGRTYFERKDNGWFAHNLQLMPAGTRWQPHDYDGEPVVLVLAEHDGENVLLSVMRIEAIDDRISRIRSCAFSPETLAEVAKTLGLRRGPAMYSFLDLGRKGQVS